VDERIEMLEKQAQVQFVQNKSADYYAIA
jgi:hypothetical protein